MKHDPTLPKRLLSYLTKDNFVIFLFHGVIKNNPYKIRNYTGKHINADLFAKCIESLSKKGNAISMDEVLFNCTNNIKLPPYSYAITFDDGFENNLTVAAPILLDYKIPSTIYVSTDFINKNSMSWIDKIELSVELTKKKSITENWLGKKELDLNSKISKIDFLNKVRFYVKNSSNINPDIFAESLTKKLGIQDVFLCKSELDKKLSWEQIKQVQKHNLISIGGHTHTHKILSFLNSEELSFELDTSIELLEKKGNTKVIHYSYPEGLKHCFNKKVIQELKMRGVKCCPTAMEGENDCKTSPFLLKRIMVG